MCGVNGNVGQFVPGLVASMNKLSSHRGPDDSGLFEDSSEKVALGHVRLSILDLSGAAHQPMIASHDRGVLVYNGELYNYRELRKDLMSKGYHFKSSGDTEVLMYGLIEYGEAFLQRLNGIFSFAFWQPLVRKLLLVRDQLGIKPLYYTQISEGELLFSSEMKTFYAHPQFKPEPDFYSIQQHLAYCHSSADRTALKGVKRLPPGYLLRWVAGSTTIERYWQRDYNDLQAGSLEYATAKLSESIQSAVLGQLVSDVPVGTFLSGGLDSSLITALATKDLGAGLRCYTSTYDMADNKLDQANPDAPYARQLAKNLGLEISEITLFPNVAELLPQLIYHLDEPIADPAAIACYLISKEASKDGTKVMLSGQGADELFSGYPRYRAMHITRHFDKAPMMFRKSVASSAAVIPGAMEGRAGALLRRSKRVLRELGDDPSRRFLAYCANTPQADISSIFSDRVKEVLGTTGYQDDCLLHMNKSGLEGFNRFRDRDISIYMPNHNLLYTDKMGMAVGVETRVPLLDMALVDKACQFPPSWLLKGRVDKLILRNAARGIVPDDIIDRPKAGFGAPYRKWLRYDLLELWEDVTSRESINSRGWFDYEAVQNIRKLSQSGKADLYMLQWAMITVELWARQFIDRKWAV
jgi:asparagine synthase (glutamine-hydrolysing)